MRKPEAFIVGILCAIPGLLNSSSGFAETCSQVKERLFALSAPPDIGTCGSEDYYPDHADACIVFQGKKYEVFKLLQQMNCPSAPSKFTWADHISSTELLIEQMKKYPHGPLDLLDQAETARQRQIDSLDAASKPKRK